MVEKTVSRSQYQQKNGSIIETAHHSQLRELGYDRYQNLLLAGGNQLAALPGHSEPVLTEKDVKMQKILGKYLLSPAFLVSSLSVMLFFPENLVRKIMAPFANFSFWEKIGKRVFDIFGSLLGFIFLSIFFFIIPIIIKLDSRGPVIYQQRRVGLNHRFKDRRIVSLEVDHERRRGERRKEDLFGRPFMVYKFRTMTQDAEKKSGAMWAQENDPRITNVGRILRFTHIDEIPQFFNVLCGEMSLVGPRPERPEIMTRLVKDVPNFPKRLQVKPGIAGIAQIVCGYDATIDDVKQKLRYDMAYVRNHSLKADIAILFQTLWVIIRGKEVLDS